MQNPILVFESDDLRVYRSAKQASGRLEIVDVEEGIYDAYDSQGYLLDLVTKEIEVERRFFCVRWMEVRRVIAVQDRSPRENRAEDVRLRLMKFLGGLRQRTEPFEELSLSELVERAGKMMPWRIDLPASEEP